MTYCLSIIIMIANYKRWLVMSFAKIEELICPNVSPNLISAKIHSAPIASQQVSMPSSASNRVGQRRLRNETLLQPNLEALKSEKTSITATQTGALGFVDPIVIGIMILLAAKLEEILSSLEDDKIFPLKEAIAKHKHQIFSLQQEISKNRSLIEKLQSEGLTSKEAIEALEKALSHNQELTRQLREITGQHELLIVDLQCVADNNAEFSKKLQQAISENKKMIQYLQKDVFDIHELQDVLVKYGNNADGLPALHAAIKKEDKRAVELLVQHGADVNAQALIFGQFGSAYINPPIHCSALHLAVLLNHVEIIQFLMINGAEVNKNDKIKVSPEELNNILMEAAAKKENPIVIAFQRFDLSIAEYLLQQRKEDLAANKLTFDFPGYNFTRIFTPRSTTWLGSPNNIAYKPVPIAVVNNWGVVEYRYEQRLDVETLNLLMKYDDQKQYKKNNSFQNWYINAYNHCDLETFLFLEKIRRAESIPINTPKASYLIDVFSGNVPFDQKNKQHFFNGMGFPPGNIFEFRHDDNEKVRELKKQIKILMNI